MWRKIKKIVIHNPRLSAGLLSGFLLYVITWIDAATGLSYDLSIFYLFPIFAVTWFWGARWGIITAIICVAAWCLADYSSLTQIIIQRMTLWSAGIRICFYFLFLVLLNMIKQQQAKLQRLAGQDALTGLANRRSFYEIASMEIHKCRRFGTIFTIVYIDVDDFKRINDTYGHNTGDAVLRIIANTMRQNTRIVDLVARMGGDEFVILLSETDAEDAKLAVRKIQKVLHQSMQDHQWPITFSMGVVTFNQPPISLDMMLEMVDHAMYSVKKASKNNVLFEQSSNMWKELKSQYITTAPLS